jgi:hypothetical protein
MAGLVPAIFMVRTCAGFFPKVDDGGVSIVRIFTSPIPSQKTKKRRVIEALQMHTIL